jgi:hypothetical protein
VIPNVEIFAQLMRAGVLALGIALIRDECWEVCRGKAKAAQPLPDQRSIGWPNLSIHRNCPTGRSDHRLILSRRRRLRHERMRVLGIDDFASRKGNAYGTILDDLECRRVVDLLRERSIESLTHWLRKCPLGAGRTRSDAGGHKQPKVQEAGISKDPGLSSSDLLRESLPLEPS